MKLTNVKKMMQKAYDQKYAIPQININNLEWTKTVLNTAQKLNSPIILGVSEGAEKYMGGFDSILGMVNGMMKNYNITVPVAIHLDHGTYDGAKRAMQAGFTSVMFDGSHLEFNENMKMSKRIIDIANKNNVSVEVEVGTLSGEEDGIIGSGEVADETEVAEIAKIHPDIIACGINNIHGQYPENWTGLRFDVLEKMKDAAKTPLVLHGGSGIPIDQIKKAIKMGVTKINVNTELQLAFSEAIKDYVLSGNIDKGKNFDPRKINSPGMIAMEKVIAQKIKEFGSNDKA